MRSLDASLLMRRRRQRAARQRRLPSSRIRRLLLAISAVLSLAAAAAALAVGLIYQDLTRDLPSIDRLPELLGAGSPYLQPARLYDRTGERLLFSLAVPGVERGYLPLDEKQPEHLSPNLARLTVAAEDPGFYRHGGATWEGVWGRAPLTIAERLASTDLLAGEAPGPRNRLRIAILGMRMTERYGRDQVLEWYLNGAGYGHLAYGAGAAAHTYFGKSGTDLTLAEAAALVSAAQNPAFDPLSAPREAENRRTDLLGRLLVDRLISPQDYLRAQDAKLNFRTNVEEPVSQVPAFTDLALAQLVDEIGMERLERGGLTVRTTLDLDLQRQAECLLRLEGAGNTGTGDAAADACPAAALLPQGSDNLPVSEGMLGSAVVLDPETGEVLALAFSGQGSLSAHPAGTVLSPFVYLAGFTQGLSPATLVWDVSPVPVDDQAAVQKQPENARTYIGPERLRAALTNDHLAPIQQILERIGPGTARDLLQGFSLPGAGLNEQGGDAFPLSESTITMLDAARAFSAFAGDGVLAGQRTGEDGALEPGVILDVRDALGETVFDGTRPETQPLVSAPLAYLVNHVLSDVSPIKSDHLPAGALEIGRPAGVKVGQTPDGTGAWTIGYTPQRLVGVWMGSGSSQQPLDTAHAARVWNGLLNYAIKDMPVRGWDAPQGIVKAQVCDPSGMLPTPDCPSVVDEVFLAGSEPAAYDDLFERLQVNRETGLLATVYTPDDLVEERVFMKIPEEYAAWAQSAGVAMPPAEYDPIRLPHALEGAHFDSPSMVQVVKGKVELRGAATVEGFAYYRILVGQGLNPQSWEQIGEDVKKPVQDGVLLEWDTSQLEGLYAVRLLVVDKENRYQEATILVTVDN